MRETCLNETRETEDHGGLFGRNNEIHLSSLPFFYSLFNSSLIYFFKHSDYYIMIISKLLLNKCYPMGLLLKVI